MTRNARLFIYFDLGSPSVRVRPSAVKCTASRNDEARPSPLTAAGGPPRAGCYNAPSRAEKLAEQEALHAKLVVSMS